MPYMIRPQYIKDDKIYFKIWAKIFKHSSLGIISNMNCDVRKDQPIIQNLKELTQKQLKFLPKESMNTFFFTKHSLMSNSDYHYETFFFFNNTVWTIEVVSEFATKEKLTHCVEHLSNIMYDGKLNHKYGSYICHILSLRK
jgi:hypothetical protein